MPKINSVDANQIQNSSNKMSEKHNEIYNYYTAKHPKPCNIIFNSDYNWVRSAANLHRSQCEHPFI